MGRGMKRLAPGTQLRVKSKDGGEDFATVLEPAPSNFTRDLYLVQWGDGTYTLFEAKKENLIKDDQTTQKKTT